MRHSGGSLGTGRLWVAILVLLGLDPQFAFGWNPLKDANKEINRAARNVGRAIGGSQELQRALPPVEELKGVTGTPIPEATVPDALRTQLAAPTATIEGTVTATMTETPTFTTHVESTPTELPSTPVGSVPIHTPTATNTITQTPTSTQTSTRTHVPNSVRLQKLLDPVLGELGAHYEERRQQAAGYEQIDFVLRALIIVPGLLATLLLAVAPNMRRTTIVLAMIAPLAQTVDSAYGISASRQATRLSATQLQQLLSECEMKSRALDDDPDDRRAEIQALAADCLSRAGVAYLGGAPSAPPLKDVNGTTGNTERKTDEE